VQLTGILDKAAAYRDSTLTVRAGLGAPLTKSFPQLRDDVRHLADSLVRLGLSRGQFVGLQAANSYEFIVWDLALLELGVVAHVFPEDWSLNEIQKATRLHRLAFTVSQLTGNLVLPESEPLSDYIHLAQDPAHTQDADLLTRVYSSGTSGKLKGLLISRHGVEHVAAQFIEDFSINEQDRFLFFLPMSHFQQRLSLYTCLSAGVSMVLTPYTHVFHDIPLFQPTFLIAPPVFYEVALATIIPRGSESEGARRLPSAFGGKLRFMITGMAPIRRGVLEAYQRYALPLLEAYGMTEVGLIAWNAPGDNHLGTVGRPLKHHRLRFAEDSEILIETEHSVGKGYFDVDTAEAAQTFLPNGCIATGDIGELDGTHLVLRGRKKDIIITSEGLKFHPSIVEERVLACALVRQAAIITDIYRNDVVVVLSVDDPHNKETISAVNETVETINGSTPGALRIARTVITRTRFAVENGMLTRNMKPNRSAIAQEFSTP
jgi:long-chain acyl-CoA synthetase